MWKIKLNPNVEEFRRSELLGKYTAKILFGWNDKKFEDEYLKKLKKNQKRWKGEMTGGEEVSSSKVGTLKERVMSEL